MIPRIEQKLEFSESQYSYFLKWLQFKKARILFPERIICSRYFDNNNLDMFTETVEGIVPRKKIRIRTYDTLDFNNSKSPYALEVKVTTEHKRLKKTEKNINYKSLIINGYFDANYGICNQKVDISYLREYFILDDMRITIDRSIKYKKANSKEYIFNKEFKEKSYVLEIKTDAEKSLTKLLNIFNFPRSRFSKYERAIENLHK